VKYTPQSHNMYNLFMEEDDTDTTDTATLNIVALTMGSTLMGVQMAPIPELVANAINQLSANQTALMTQMAALSCNNVPPLQANQHYAPPIQQLTIPGQHPFAVAAMGGFNPGNGGSGRGGHSRQGRGGCSGGHNQCTPFANYGRTQGVRSVSQGQGSGRLVPQAPGAFTLQAPSFVPTNAQNIAVPFSNTVKRNANWNVYYTCRFHMEDGHTSITCHKAWQKPNHQEGFTHANVQEYLNVGWDPFTKGMLKTQLPGF
jgi:hypothetical protein